MHWPSRCRWRASCVVIAPKHIVSNRINAPFCRRSNAIARGRAKRPHRPKSCNCAAANSNVCVPATPSASGSWASVCGGSKATATEIDVQVPLHDTIARRDFAAVCDSGRLAAAVRFDTVRSFRWRDPWVTVEGRIRGDSADCRVESVDTLRQVVHRVPRRFLFIRFGTKAVRQEIVSSNPHTRIVYAEYVRFAK